jgi:hypothetical protein
MAREGRQDALLTGLDNQLRDRLTPLAKGVVGACPVIGPMLAEAVGMAIPNQRVERIVAFVRALEARVGNAEAMLTRMHERLQTYQGIDLLEEGLTQAARAVSEERQARLAQLVGASLTAEELRHEESKKLLGLLRELTDPEVVWLIHYSVPVTSGSAFHESLMKLHPEILEPVTSSLNASEAEQDRGALQESYKNTLRQLGLLETNNNFGEQISHLGMMLMRYIRLPGEQACSV